MYNACKVHWASCAQETVMVYILYNQNETAAKRKITKRRKNRNGKSVFYLAKWTDFTLILSVLLLQ